MKHSTKQPSQRQLRAGELLRHIIAETMQRGHFQSEELMDAGRITVSEVRVSPDLKNATAYVMALGGEDMVQILPALNNAAHVFQTEINKKSSLKFTPRVQFKADTTFDEAARIENILRSVNLPSDE